AIADRDARGQPALPRAHRGLPRRDRRAARAQHVVQRERAGRLHAGRGARLLPAHAHGPAGAGRLPRGAGLGAMRVVFVNRYYYPDISATSQILTDLAVHLAARHDVHVVASRQRIDAPGARLAAGERVDGVTVHRVWTSRFGRDRLAGRALDYATFQ